MQRKINIFLSYAHEDEELRKELVGHLSVLKHEGLVQTWSDRDIDAGTDRQQAIDEHLDKADLILLLISSAFVSSEYCYSTEMARAMEKHHARRARVIPIILRPVLWKSAPFGKLQALPSNEQPITSWQSQDEAFLNVAEAIHKVIKELADTPLLLEPLNEPVPSSHTSRNNIQVTMLGTSAAGKTSFLLAMYDVWRSGIQGFTLSAKDIDDDLYLSNLWDELTLTRGEERWPKPSTQTQMYSFNLNYGLKPFQEINWLDYRGGALRDRSTDEDLRHLRRHLENSSCVFLCISAEYLKDGIGGYESVIKRKAGIDRMLLFLTQLPEIAQPSIVIVVTKYDLISSSRNATIIDDIRKLFYPLFVPNSPWSFMICPVTLGMGLKEDVLAGDIFPQNIHIPLMFSIQQQFGKELSDEKVNQDIIKNRLSKGQPRPWYPITGIPEADNPLEQIKKQLQKIQEYLEKIVLGQIDIFPKQQEYKEQLFEKTESVLENARELNNDRTTNVERVDGLLISGWAPLVFGRTLKVDFRMLAIPSDFTEEDIMWAKYYIRGTFDKFEQPHSQRWAVFKNERYCVFGVNCRAQQVSVDMYKDDAGRPLSVFLGYVSHKSDSDNLPSMSLELFRQLYGIARERWLEQAWQQNDLNPKGYIYDLQANNYPLPEKMFLNTDDHSVSLWPRDYEDRLWDTAGTYDSPISLCLGLSRRLLAQEGPFLNASTFDIIQPVTLSRSSPA